MYNILMKDQIKVFDWFWYFVVGIWCPYNHACKRKFC